MPEYQAAPEPASQPVPVQGAVNLIPVPEVLETGVTKIPFRVGSAPKVPVAVNPNVGFPGLLSVSAVANVETVELLLKLEKRSSTAVQPAV